MSDNICQNCNHPYSELRRRRIAGGSVQFVYQCLKCGRTTSNPVPKASIYNPDALLAWDDCLQSKYDNSERSRHERERETEHAQWLREHDAYLKTPEWRERRRLVMDRAKGFCEGCRKAPATQVHHLTYEHWKNEFLWELVAICVPCHERMHAESKSDAA